MKRSATHQPGPCYDFIVTNYRHNFIAGGTYRYVPSGICPEDWAGNIATMEAEYGEPK